MRPTRYGPCDNEACSCAPDALVLTYEVGGGASGHPGGLFWTCVPGLAPLLAETEDDEIRANIIEAIEESES